MSENIKHIFIIGAKSIGQYGGYETFVDKLSDQHKNDEMIRYHIACKANGEGSMDESKLDGVTVTKHNPDGTVSEFEYNNAHVFKIKCPNIGPAVAIFYDCAALRYCIEYCKAEKIDAPIFYILACRIGLFIIGFKKQISALNGHLCLNPDGHEWKRSKWSLPIRMYWKWSEKKMVREADVVVCDSVNIENYIQTEYHHPCTTYISYGADVEKSKLADDDPSFTDWLREKDLEPSGYYLIVGRFVPENNYETMIREFMRSSTKRNLAIITNKNEKLSKKLEEMLSFSSDPRIRFVGTVYNSELLKKIRENAYGYIHGHEVGGTNPSLLEALGSTKLNLLLDIGFNKEVGREAALYWNKNDGDLANLINKVDTWDEPVLEEYGGKAKDVVTQYYSWQYIGDEYRNLWLLY